MVVDYVDAVYNHTLRVSGNYPGTYEFFAKNPFVVGTDQFITSRQDVNSEGNNLVLMAMCIFGCHGFSSDNQLAELFCFLADLCSGVDCFKPCDDGYQYDNVEQQCLGKLVAFDNLSQL